MKSRNNTLMSVGLGLAALVFAFFLIFSDPQNGGQMMQQLKGTADSLTRATVNAPEAGKALAPEGRIDGFPLPGGEFGQAPPLRLDAAPLPSAASLGAQAPVSDAAAYLDNAWGAGGQAQQSATRMEQSRMPLGRSFGGNFQERFNNTSPRGGFMQPEASGAFPNSAAARSSVEYELNQARARASQAAECMYRARNASDRGEKQAAASQARSHASAASAAASRAMSQGGGIPELQGLVGQVRALANQADNSASQAAIAASGW